MVGPLDATYHDTGWGVPSHDDRGLFERLMLEGFQAGLSWPAILARREHFWRAFEGWDAERIARYGPDDIARLMNDRGHHPQPPEGGGRAEERPRLPGGAGGTRVVRPL